MAFASRWLGSIDEIDSNAEEGSSRNSMVAPAPLSSSPKKAPERSLAERGSQSPKPPKLLSSSSSFEKTIDRVHALGRSMSRVWRPWPTGKADPNVERPVASEASPARGLLGCAGEVPWRS